MEAEAWKPDPKLAKARNPHVDSLGAFCAERQKPPRAPTEYFSKWALPPFGENRGNPGSSGKRKGNHEPFGKTKETMDLLAKKKEENHAPFVTGHHGPWQKNKEETLTNPFSPMSSSFDPRGADVWGFGRPVEGSEREKEYLALEPIARKPEEELRKTPVLAPKERPRVEEDSILSPARFPSNS